MSLELSFRPAQRVDCPLILQFIKDLAEYEKRSDQVKATVELLEEWLFEKNVAEVFFALVSGKEVAFALYFPHFSTFVGQAGLYLEDLYVLPEYRGRGIGKACLRKLAQIALERGYGRFDWQCLDWNTPGIKFYESLEAKPLRDWITFRLEGKTLDNLAKDENNCL